MAGHLDRLNRAAAFLPGECRNAVMAHVMADELDLPVGTSPEGRRMASALRNASRGIPVDDEQAALWRRLGIDKESK